MLLSTESGSNPPANLSLPPLNPPPPHCPAGLTPFWPNALAGLTGLTDGEGSELPEAVALLEPLLQ